jgi:trypsin
MEIQALFSALAFSILLATTALSRVDDQPRSVDREIGFRYKLVARGTSIKHRRQTVRYELASRIYGGVETASGRYPYIAILSRSISPGVGMPICAGSLISSKVILTAAHCIGLVDTIWLGVENINMLQEGIYEMYSISNPIVSPNFNSSNVENDFALLFLDKPSSFKPITFNTDFTQPKVGSEVYAIGWGKTESGHESPVPREANLVVLSDMECASMYTPYANISGSMMCATGGSQRDACQGDSGGPLIIKGQNATADILVGMVSWGFDCADSSFPGVYSRISTAAMWLKQYIT